LSQKNYRMRLRRSGGLLLRGVAIMGLFCVEARAEYSPSFEWQTSEHSLLCPTPLALKEAQIASDVGWFNETGCTFAQGGLRIVLMEAVETRDHTISVWRGRIYPANGRPSFSAYFLEGHALTYAIYGPFRTRQSAERETKAVIDDILKRVPQGSLPYEIVETAPASFSARIGPQFYKAVDVFCLTVLGRERDINRPSVPCRIVGKLP
jgi:hypothetical protein